LIIGLFEPDMEEEAANDKYRPMLTEVAKAMKGKYHVTYMDTERDRVWAESQFGAVYFPAIAINKNYPGKTVLYTGDMSAPAVLQFLRNFAEIARAAVAVMRCALLWDTQSCQMKSVRHCPCCVHDLPKKQATCACWSHDPHMRGQKYLWMN